MQCTVGLCLSPRQLSYYLDRFRFLVWVYRSNVVDWESKISTLFHGVPEEIHKRNGRPGKISFGPDEENPIRHNHRRKTKYWGGGAVRRQHRGTHPARRLIIRSERDPVLVAASCHEMPGQIAAKHSSANAVHFHLSLVRRRSLPWKPLLEESVKKTFEGSGQTLSKNFPALPKRSQNESKSPPIKHNSTITPPLRVWMI